MRPPGSPGWFKINLTGNAGPAIVSHAGCCDSSPHRHARKHFHATQRPIIQSFERGENRRWCFVHEALV